MNKEKESESVLDGITEMQLESLARCLLEPCRKYLESKQGKKDYEEWEKAVNQTVKIYTYHR